MILIPIALFSYQISGWTKQYSRLFNTNCKVFNICLVCKLLRQMERNTIWMALCDHARERERPAWTKKNQPRSLRCHVSDILFSWQRLISVIYRNWSWLFMKIHEVKNNFYVVTNLYSVYWRRLLPLLRLLLNSHLVFYPCSSHKHPEKDMITQYLHCGNEFNQYRSKYTSCFDKSYVRSSHVNKALVVRMRKIETTHRKFQLWSLRAVNDE